MSSVWLRGNKVILDEQLIATFDGRAQAARTFRQLIATLGSLVGKHGPDPHRIDESLAHRLIFNLPRLSYCTARLPYIIIIIIISGRSSPRVGRRTCCSSLLAPTPRTRCAPARSGITTPLSLPSKADHDQQVAGAPV